MLGPEYSALVMGRGPVAMEDLLDNDIGMGWAKEVRLEPGREG